MSPLSVNTIMGIPFCGRNIAETGDSRKSEFLKKFNATSIPVITFFGSKILLKDEISDDQFLRCFMVVALPTFLCPNSSTYPSLKYFFPLIEAGTVDEWD
uniref:Uncharacterized protein n=1 Tax=Arundo donax TaxID=35708 RepID=A0A0A9D7D8_ARUDO